MIPKETTKRVDSNQQFSASFHLETTNIINVPPLQAVPNDNSSELCQSLKKLLVEWMETSSWTGPPLILRTTNKIRRIFWLFMFLLFMGSTIYMLYYLIEQYVAYTEVTSTSIRSDAVTQFPTITICSLNPYFLDELTPPYIFEQLNNYSFYSQNFFDFNGTEDTLNNTFAPVRLQKLIASAKYSEYNRMYRLAEELGWDSLLRMFQSKILSCSFMGVSCNLLSDFKISLNMDNMFCFKFNSEKQSIKASAKADPLNGFQLRLYLGAYNDLVIYVT
jgi:hypothetical protein